ncbi:MAG: hypothetical protein FJX73_10610 [Armatimonadetes bacterium]|nr:hypothetical protein [Armatimonadota bacterium]
MRRSLLEPAVVFAVALVIYVMVTPRTNTAYRHYVYMASAFLQGRVDLRGLPAHYHDVIRIGDRVYAPFPPVPAVLLMPVVALQGEGADQGRVGQVLAGAAAAVLVAALRRMGFPLAVRLFCAAALSFGSVLWPAVAIGTTWFFAQVVVVLAMAVLVWEMAGGARPAVVGAVLAAAWLTRLSVLPAVPAVAAILWLRHRTLRALVPFALASAAGMAVYLTYNALRFGDPLQSGYGLLSMASASADAVARWGFFNVRYVPEHLAAMFLRLPDLIPDPPYLRPSPHGMALWITSPVVVRLLFTRADRRAWLPWAAVILSMLVPMLFFFSVGWVQYGYRYSLDWWVPVLVLLAGALRSGPLAVDLALLAAGIAVNGTGVYWVRALGW